MAWPPSAALEGGARSEGVGGMESELVPTEPIQTYPASLLFCCNGIDTWIEERHCRFMQRITYQRFKRIDRALTINFPALSAQIWANDL